MIVSFDANILVYASGAGADEKRTRSNEVMERGMLCGAGVLLLQALAEFSNVALRKYRVRNDAVDAMVSAWQATMPVHAAAQDDLAAALGAVRGHGIQFWDAMLWATARRVGVRHILSEDFQDGRVLDGVTFLNPFNPANDAVIDRLLPRPQHEDSRLSHT